MQKFSSVGCINYIPINGEITKSYVSVFCFLNFPGTNIKGKNEKAFRDVLSSLYILCRNIYFVKLKMAT